ncbi:hypothetical protein G7085_08325 [Tessaracoccus sp. HDW20]|uniref:hypothetical protein n=1 Tax=Tessaracoccus coleopterorum TaxID=2714950 RepID=UPI0018D3FB3F|nr:hypothetical protein [Tessaracoccus coleopterorum]NHB84615.1 hypothetical protein [Tessaracoccus coleopterorum]
MDADDAQATEAHDRLQKATDELNQLGDNLAKVAADAAYATIGLVGVVSDRVKGYYEEQKKQYSTDHPDLTEEPTAKHLLSQLNDQLDSFVGDLGKVFRDLVDRAGQVERPPPMGPPIRWTTWQTRPPISPTTWYRPRTRPRRPSGPQPTMSRATSMPRTARTGEAPRRARVSLCATATQGHGPGVRPGTSLSPRAVVTAARTDDLQGRPPSRRRIPGEPRMRPPRNGQRWEMAERR